MNYDEAVKTAMGGSMSPKRINEVATTVLNQLERFSLADQRAVVKVVNERIGAEVEKALDEVLGQHVGNRLDADEAKTISTEMTDKLVGRRT